MAVRSRTVFRVCRCLNENRKKKLIGDVFMFLLQPSRVGPRAHRRPGRTVGFAKVLVIRPSNKGATSSAESRGTRTVGRCYAGAARNTLRTIVLNRIDEVGVDSSTA